MNHRLQATGPTALFDAGVPEAVIQKRTGHQSVDALRVYERVTIEQEKSVAEILTPQSPKSTVNTSSDSIHFSGANPGVNMSIDDNFIDSLPEEAFIF